ncbi:MAG TPA: hypothetical protein VE287_00375, partial [Actinopolymorphaceae bacterium]|nr:hypothetical protein [Actinopolymorphaceae bacterium]
MTKDRSAQAVPARFLGRAAELLSQAWGTPVAVVGEENLEHSGHAFVVRLLLSGGPAPSVVLKLAHADPTTAFDRHDVDPWGPAARLWNEWAGLEFLTSLASPQPPVPAFHAGDADLGLLLMEDLGSGPSLADVLLDRSPDRARVALDGYVDALADIHLATLAHVDTFERRRRAFGGEPAAVPALLDGDGQPLLLQGLGALADDADIDAASDAIRWVDGVVRSPGRWRAFNVNDCCPDNNRVYADGRVRLFDLEFCTVQHALLGLAYVRTTMPTCWCQRRLGIEMSEALVRRYQDRLRVGGFDVQPEEFDTALNACEAYWAIETARWHVERALGPGGDDPPVHRHDGLPACFAATAVPA